MASRKTLKKNIKNITGELFADCVALSLCEGADRAALEQLMAETLALNTEYVTRISHTERGSEKLFYRKLRAEFAEKAAALGERIVAL